MLFRRKEGLHMNQQAIRAVAKIQEIDEEMRELMKESMSASATNERPASEGSANSTASIKPVVPSDLNTLLERMSELSLAEMDRSIQELQKARNFLRNERERMRQEMAEYLRLTQNAVGSAKAVTASIANFETGAEEISKSRAPL
jgi:hypothetical protein